MLGVDTILVDDNPYSTARYSLHARDYVHGDPRNGLRAHDVADGAIIFYFTSRGQIVEHGAAVDISKHPQQARTCVFLERLRDQEGRRA